MNPFSFSFYFFFSNLQTCNSFVWEFWSKIRFCSEKECQTNSEIAAAFWYLYPSSPEHRQSPSFVILLLAIEISPLLTLFPCQKKCWVNQLKLGAVLSWYCFGTLSVWNGLLCATGCSENGSVSLSLPVRIIKRVRNCFSYVPLLLEEYLAPIQYSGIVDWTEWKVVWYNVEENESGCVVFVFVFFQLIYL